jgi:hypothetical protein
MKDGTGYLRLFCGHGSEPGGNLQTEYNKIFKRIELSVGYVRIWLIGKESVKVKLSMCLTH